VSNNYTKFSMIFELPSREKRDWTIDFFKKVNKAVRDSEESEEVEKSAKTKKLTVKPSKIENVIHRLSTAFAGHSTFEFQESHEDGEIWIYSEECTNLGLVINSIQAVMRHFKLDTIVKFTWAYTCSRPIIDQFGGGFACISRHAKVMRDTYFLVDSAEHDMASKFPKLIRNVK
jgi:hypothetical protein